MDTSKIFHPNQEYNLGKGTLLLNTFNGRMLYSYPITMIGFGNFQIDVSLVYNSLYNVNDFYDKKLGFGNGWKYNFEEYIFKYNEKYCLSDFSPLDYVYIDSNWCIHKFVEYKSTVKDTKVYYDESGTGLKLIVKNNVDYKMIDEYNNQYYFDKESGKLIKKVSSINSLIVKNIVYDDNKEKVLFIYDSRKSNKKIVFEYNDNNLPIKVYSTKSEIIYNFEYINDKLIAIFKENNKNIKKIHEFVYKNSLMHYIINSEDSQVIELKYINSYVNTISFATMKEEIVIDNINSNSYLGDDIYAGEANFITNNGKKYVTSNWIIPNEYIYSNIKYDYQIAYTEVTNYKGIKKRYYFDIDGRCINSLEYNDDNFSEIHSYTKSKPIGWEIGEDGDTNIFINDKKAKTILKIIINIRYLLIMIL